MRHHFLDTYDEKGKNADTGNQEKADEKTDKKLKEVLTEEEYDLIMAKNKSEVKNLEFKFKITEVFQNIF